MTKEAMIKWLEECARYFDNKHDNGEDRAHWANFFNARNAREIADYIKNQP